MAILFSTLKIFAWRKKVVPFFLVIILTGAMTIGAGAINPVRAQWELAIGWVGVVGTAVGIYGLVQNLHRSSSGYTIDFKYPEELKIFRGEDEKPVASLTETIYPEHSYLYWVSTPEQGSFFLRIDSHPHPLRGYPTYETFLSPGLFQKVREEGKKMILVEDEKGKEIFTLTLTAVEENGLEQEE